MPRRLKPFKVAIIGAGPSGIATAIQLKRHGIEPLVLESKKIGGLLNNANRVENYLGFPKSIEGQALVDLFQKHVQNAGIAIKHSRVTSVSFREKLFNIQASGGNYRSGVLVVASGTKPKQMIDCHLTKNLHRRIYYEVYPIRHIAKKSVVIIGGGDAAFDYALTLARRNKIKILNRSEKARCLPILQKRIRKNKNITYIPGIKVLGITLSHKALNLHCSNGKIITADNLLVATGREPNLDFLNRGIIKDKQKLVRRKKMYIIGDAGNGKYRQAAIAVGDGIRAGMKIAEKIAEEHRRKRAERRNI